MDAKSFLNFDILIERAEPGFRARVLNSPGGQAVHSFVLPFSLDTVTSPRDSRAAAAFGKQLFDAVFAEKIEIAFRSSVTIAASQNQGLRIRLRLNDVPELAAVPWELLHDGQDFFALSTQRAVVRYLELPQAIKPLTVTPPLRALIVLSSPAGYDPLDIGRESQILKDAISDISATGIFEYKFLTRPTLADLQEELRKTEYHILHFGGHGEYNASATDDAKGTLIFQDENGYGQRVGAIALARLLRDRGSMQLVVLNACEGARADSGNAFAGMAQTLIRQAIPSVIAMQFSLSDGAAQLFTRAFYRALADSLGIDEAIGAARLALSNPMFGLEWATPILFSRADDGQLFAIDNADTSRLRELERAARTLRASQAFSDKNFVLAMQDAQRLMELNPADVGAQQLLKNARDEVELAQLYDEAKKLFLAQQWQPALDALRQIQNLRLRYRDTDELTKYVEQQISSRVAISNVTKPRAKDNLLETHYTAVIKALINGRLVPFLGGGVNLIGRPQGAVWPQEQYAPTSQELAGYLADTYSYTQEDSKNIVAVSQYIAVMNPSDTLKSELHSVFDTNYPSSHVHRLLATMPQTLREKGYKLRAPVIISTTYDDILERTFQAANEPFDLVTYIADGDDKGKWWHHTFEGQDILIKTPNNYVDMQPDQRAMIVKIHGMVNRADADRESYVITEDHYIDYLTSSDTASLLPIKIKERLSLSSFLFMGYSPRDWNLRVLLYRIWENSNAKNLSWAIQPAEQSLEGKIWQRRGVSVIEAELEEYLDELETRVRDYPRAGGVR